MTFDWVELLVCEDPPLEAVLEVEELVLALLDPPGLLLAEEPVWVVVPAVPPAPACDDPLAEVDVDADPLPVPVGVGVGAPVGLDELDALLPLPVDDWPELEVPPAVLAVPDPDPCAVVPPESVGVVCVFEPVLVAALPMPGLVEPLDVLPAVAEDELPVEADAEDPLPEPEFAVVDEFVPVVALAEPPVAVVVGEGVGVGEV